MVQPCHQHNFPAINPYDDGLDNLLFGVTQKGAVPFLLLPHEETRMLLKLGTPKRTMQRLRFA
jgi:hypothetical protein